MMDFITFSWSFLRAISLWSLVGWIFVGPALTTGTVLELRNSLSCAVLSADSFFFTSGAGGWVSFIIGALTKEIHVNMLLLHQCKQLEFFQINIYITQYTEFEKNLLLFYRAIRFEANIIHYGEKLLQLLVLFHHIVAKVFRLKRWLANNLSHSYPLSWSHLNAMQICNKFDIHIKNGNLVYFSVANISMYTSPISQ